MKKIYSATITPLREDYRIDGKSLEKILTRNMRHGINGFFLLGSMGEGIVMPEKDADELIELSCGIVGKRADIFVGLTTVGFIKTLQRMESIAKHPFDYYVINTPGVYDRAPCPVKHLLDLASEADRPVYIYYLPSISGRPLSIAQFREILSHPNIKGMKNSSGSMYLRKELILLKKEIEFELYEGEEWCIDEALIAGCDGALIGMAALGSKLMTEIARAVEKCDYEKAMETQRTLIKIFHGVYGPDVSTIVDGHKYAMYKMGLIENTTTFYRPNLMSEDVKQRIANCINTYREILD